MSRPTIDDIWSYGNGVPLCEWELEEIRDQKTTKCEYCSSIVPGIRCNSCGAPLTQKLFIKKNSGYA